MSRPPAAHLFEVACASLNHSSDVLVEAAAGLSSASLDMLASAVALKPGREKRRAMQPRVSPYFPVQVVPDAAANGTPQPEEKEKKQRKRKKKMTSSQVGPQVSPFFAPPTHGATSVQSLEPSAPPGLSFELQSPCFGLIQERICGDLFALVVQAILWNKTRGTAARPILWALLCGYPTPRALASANVADIEDMVRKLGLQQVRARRLVDMARAWIASPPTPERRYGRRHYPAKGSNPAVKDGELLGPDDVREGWEIGHLPGVGEYALDSFRIFGRDRLRGIADDAHVEPEWKRLVPRDKELGPYVRWKWAQEGWDYQVATGIRRRM